MSIEKELIININGLWRIFPNIYRWYFGCNIESTWNAWEDTWDNKLGDCCDLFITSNKQVRISQLSISSLGWHFWIHWIIIIRNYYYYCDCCVNLPYNKQHTTPWPLPMSVCFVSILLVCDWEHRQLRCCLSTLYIRLQPRDPSRNYHCHIHRQV